jgi:mannose-6-phosphate isomerase
MKQPVRLEPSFREKVWGTRELSPWFAPQEEKIGEVWFEWRPPLPILVKFIFTSENLSVQVHPGGRAGKPGKTEMWHILWAASGARIALGFRRRISKERLREAALSGEIEGLLEWFPVKAGETYLTPAGTVHAIGGGVALCEIQQNSDVTYRLYDYGRPRELHVEEAVAVADTGPHPGPSQPWELGEGRALLVDCSYFAAESLTFKGRRRYAPDPTRLELLIVVEGCGDLGGQAFRAGEVWLIPAGTGEFAMHAEGGARMLRSYVPESAGSRAV